MTFKPPGYKSIAATPDEERHRICECPACTRDGQHEPMCNVHDCHWDEGAKQVCDCPKRAALKEGRQLIIEDTPELRRAIARAALDDLEDRRGLTYEFAELRSMYPETYAEIEEAIAANVMRVLAGAAKKPT